MTLIPMVVLSCLIAIFSISQQSLANESTFKFEANKYLDNDCEWRMEGCVKFDNDEIDYRSSAKVHLDSLFSCKNSIEGCSNDQLNTIDRLKNAAYSEKQFSTLLERLDPYLEKQSHFIPLGLNNKELLILATSTSLGLVIFPSDAATMNFIQEHKSNLSEKIVIPTNEYLKPISLGVAAGSYFVGAVMEDNKIKSAGLYVVTAGLASQIITEGFKKGFGRQRPNKNIKFYDSNEGGKSFFSAHSSGAWSMATVFAEVYKGHKYIPYVAYSIAALTSYGRLHDNKNHLSDVFYGAVAGHLVTKAVMRIHENDDSAGGFNVTPSYDFTTGTAWLYFEYVAEKSKEEWECTKLPKGTKERIRGCIQEAYYRSEQKSIFDRFLR